MNNFELEIAYLNSIRIVVFCVAYGSKFEAIPASFCSILSAYRILELGYLHVVSHPFILFNQAKAIRKQDRENESLIEPAERFYLEVMCIFYYFPFFFILKVHLYLWQEQRKITYMSNVGFNEL